MKIYGDPPTEAEWRAHAGLVVDVTAVESAFDSTIKAAERVRALFAFGPRAPVKLDPAADVVSRLESNGPVHRVVRVLGATAEYTLRELAIVALAEGVKIDHHKLSAAVRAISRKIDTLVQCDPGGEVPAGPVEILPPQWTPRLDDEGRSQGAVRVRFTVIARIALHPEHPELNTGLR